MVANRSARLASSSGEKIAGSRSGLARRDIDSGGAGPSAPAAAPSAPAAAPVPLALFVELPVSAPAGGVADPPVPVPGAPVAPPTSVPDVPAPASVSSPKAASATTGGPAPSVAPVRTCGDANGPSRSAHRLGAGVTLHGATNSNLTGLPNPAVTGAGGVPAGAVAAALPLDPLPAAAPPPQVLAPTLLAPAASAPAPGARLRLPPVPPVVGVEFVAAGGGAAGARYSPHVAGGSAFLAADEPFHFLAEALQPPLTRVPEATLGQLSRLAESLHARLLIQVLAHASLPAIPAETFHDRPRETCLDAADQLALLLGPVLAAPAEGGTAAVGQLDEAVRGLRRHLRAGSGAAAIGASTLVVRELWRTLTAVLHALGAHRM
ncbi:unnamed protein product [Closterium sp. Naga37s-1]|nr:unnamed protein product [Closterium sp. Naga37s-1]